MRRTLSLPIIQIRLRSKFTDSIKRDPAGTSRKRGKTTTIMPPIKVITLFCEPYNGSDNFAYVICSSKSNMCALVDVSACPDQILEFIQKESLSLTTILTTHKHMDHAGGNLQIKGNISPNINLDFS